MSAIAAFHVVAPPVIIVTLRDVSLIKNFFFREKNFQSVRQKHGGIELSQCELGIIRKRFIIIYKCILVVHKTENNDMIIEKQCLISQSDTGYPTFQTCHQGIL